jgi:beta-galactosidase
LRGATGHHLPEGVTARVRTSGSEEYLFLLNFALRRRAVRLDGGAWEDALDAKALPRRVVLQPLGFRVCRNRSRPAPAAG